MEPWAKRLADLIEAGADRGLSVPGLVKAVKAKQSSVWQWFKPPPGKKVTKMISADNAVRAAAYVGTTVEYLMTGRGSPGDPSHPARLDEAKLAERIQMVDSVIARERKSPSPRLRSRMIAASYAIDLDASGEAAKAVEAMISTVLSEMESAK